MTPTAIAGVTVVQADVPAQTIDVAPQSAAHQKHTLDPSLPATTTSQEDLVTAGQRRINLIWEFTQAAVTIMITAAAIYCAIRHIDADVLNFAFVAVISTYYARTNHTKIGGVGFNQAGR